MYKIVSSPTLPLTRAFRKKVQVPSNLVRGWTRRGTVICSSVYAATSIETTATKASVGKLEQCLLVKREEGVENREFTTYQSTGPEGQDEAPTNLAEEERVSDQTAS